jgi:hypothetical protein
VRARLGTDDEREDILAQKFIDGVVALEPGSVLLDQFSPRREDYLTT